MAPRMMFDRTVSDALMDALDGGALAPLLDFVLARPETTDLQLHHSKSRRSRASLYLGLTKVLAVEEQGGAFRFDTHATHEAAGGFEAAWRAWRTRADVVDLGPQ